MRILPDKTAKPIQDHTVLVIQGRPVNPDKNLALGQVINRDILKTGLNRFILLG